MRRATKRSASSLPSISISIHALLAESDDTSKDVIKTTTNFYPRSPCGERPALSQSSAKSTPISIHALLAESDPPKSILVHYTAKFLSTLSLRRATRSYNLCSYDPRFLSTLSLRRATVKDATARSNAQFLSTLSLRRATVRMALWQILIKYFYPRSPCGERQASADCFSKSTLFLSTLSLRRATSAL